MSKRSEVYTEFVDNLEQRGLNLTAAFDLCELPYSIVDTMPEDSALKFRSLLLVGTKGSAFWQYLKDINKTEGHCFDEMSQALTLRILNQMYPDLKTLVLYPSSEYVLPLQQLGHLVGWGRPSVLGLDIHPEFGTWFAYRTAILVSDELPASEYVKTDEVCDVCVDKPCQGACPAGAVRTIGRFEITACIENRIRDNSACADRCLARLACPIGKDYFYQQDHLAHHSRFSLAGVKRYRGNTKW